MPEDIKVVGSNDDKNKEQGNVGEQGGDDKKKKSDETVTIKKDTLESLMERLQRLEASADKKQLSRYDSAHRDTYGEIIGIRRYNGRRIVGWKKMPINRVEKNPQNKVWQEDQKVELIYEDKTTEKVDYATYQLRYELEMGTVKHKDVEEVKVKDVTGKNLETRQKITYTLVMENEEEITIDSKFVN